MKMNRNFNLLNLKNTILKHKHIIALRPCPKNAISPDQIEKVLGKNVVKYIR